MKIGYLAIGNLGSIHRLMGKGSARKQLLDMYATKRCYKKHIGYIVRGEWFEIFEIHTWSKANAK